MKLETMFPTHETYFDQVLLKIKTIYGCDAKVSARVPTKCLRVLEFVFFPLHFHYLLIADL